MDAPRDDEDESSTQEQQQALLEQMRALRASLERQDGVLKQRASSLEQQREAAQLELGRTALSIIDEVASAPSLVLDVVMPPSPPCFFVAFFFCDAASAV